MSQSKSLKQYVLLHATGFLALVRVAGGSSGYALYFGHESSRETLRYLQLKKVFDSSTCRSPPPNRPD